MKQKNIFYHPVIKIKLLLGLTICAVAFVFPPQKLFAQKAVKNNEISGASVNTPSAQINFDKANTEQYLIGTGDVLDVRIFNRPLLSREAVRVNGHGRIQLPLIGELQAACLTESELSKAITKLYLEYLKNPNVEVFIKEYQSKPVMVIGAVRDAGQFQLRRRVRLLELLSLAGGLTDQADGRIQVKHSPDAQTCDETDVEIKTALSVEWYDVADLLRQSDNNEQNPYVQPGDTINLLEADKAFVVGNVVKPSTVLLKGKTTIAEAVAAAGGVLPDSKLEKVRILRQVSANDKTKQEIVIDLKAINKRQAEDIALQANDIIDVPSSDGKKFLRGLLNNIAPTISRSAVRVIP